MANGKRVPWDKKNQYHRCWKIEEGDVWNFDTTLALFIADGLDKLREISHGYPGHTTEDSWAWQLEHHAKKFREYAADNKEDITESMLWLAYNYTSLWD